MDGGCVRNQRGGSVVSEEKQIEEMARFVCSSFHGHHDCENCSLYEERCCVSFCAARRLYNASYRKQSEGEWREDVIAFCNVCSRCQAKVDRYAIKCNSGKLHFCPNCGAKMKGGE